jgi:tetratricopeptide (TPR) repeat protein
MGTFHSRGRRFALACARVLLSATSVLLFASVVEGDTIVLKNGRRILALSVTDDGEKVHYLTPAGELTLPKSIVDHIEKGGAMPAGEGPASAANLAITPPGLEISAAPAGLEGSVVHDGAVDRDFIAKLEGEAHSGGKRASDLAAMAHHVAAEYELSRGDTEHALDDERTALNFAPEQPGMLMSMAYLHLRRSEYKQSLEYLERARRVEPENPDVAKLEGWAYYGMNKLDQAVDEWKKAMALRPEAEVKAALQKALRDKQEEENYKENESSHFTLKYSGDSEPGLAHDVLRTLEDHFSAIESELNFTPPDAIGVVLYTRQSFSDITRAPGWVGALNDGRIRVPVQGLTSMTPELSRVLKHELTHSFVGQKTSGRAPTWIQEGLAQWMEGKRSDESAAFLLQVYDEHQAATLSQLEGSWMRMDSNTANYAYAWALANIEYIVRAGGMGDVERILDHIASGEAPSAAVHEVVHSDYADLTQSTADYLRKTYGH